MKTAPSPEQLGHVVQAAALAPSVHNTRPWRFVQRAGSLELFTDRHRRLAVLDPDGRQLHLSCGAALLHAEVGARALGLDVHSTLLPDPARPDLLASLELTTGRPPTDDDLALAGAILERHVHRGGFEERPVPPALIDLLALDASAHGARLQHLVAAADLDTLASLLLRADGHERYDGHASGAGTGVVVLATDDDTRVSWLRGGQALAAVLLRAVDHGVQAQPLGQLTDVPSYRLEVARSLHVAGMPQLVLRIGYAARSPVPLQQHVGGALTA